MRAASAARWASTALLSLVASCVAPREADQTVRRAPGAAATLVAGRTTFRRDSRDADEAAVVLVVLDGVRWQDVFVGSDPTLAAAAKIPARPADALMPHLHALIADRGAAIGAPGEGAPMVASGPNFVSLPGYTEIFTGRAPSGCTDNDCPATLLPTVADEVRAVSNRTSDVAVITSWPKIERAASADPSGIVLSAGRSRTVHGELLRDDPVTLGWLDAGAEAPPFPGYDEYRPDVYTAAIGLRYLETRRPRFLFLGLGEPDEYAHRADYASYLGSLRAADDVIGQLFATLARMGARGQHTTVLVTADHGRGRDFRVHGKAFPESSRVWLVAAGGAIAARGLARATRPHRLADVAPTIRQLLALPADVAPTSGAPIDELFVPPPEQSARLP
ncbi:MAG: alkaline phosphatase family protein [Polyangiaceae bacterium]